MREEEKICRGSAYENTNIPSVTENISIEVPQKTSIYGFSVALAYGIPFIIFHNIFNGPWLTYHFIGTSSTYPLHSVLAGIN